MIFGGEFVPGIDLVDVCLWAFTIFFFGLVFYLQQESRREGFPLEEDRTGKIHRTDFVFYPPKKTFNLPNGQGTVSVPPGTRDKRPLAMERTAVWDGAPYTPTGNPMKDGVGPAAYTDRMDIPDVTDDGRPRIVPFRAEPDYTVPKQDLDPRGLPVVGCDGKTAGVVTDLWVDRSEAIIRYLEVNIGDEAMPKSVLLPMTFAVINGGPIGAINKGRKRVEVHAIRADQFADVPVTRQPEQVTRLEEDKICGYYGGGKLYATPDRLGPWI